MKTLITEFISLDGVVQAPGGVDEDNGAEPVRYAIQVACLIP